MSVNIEKFTDAFKKDALEIVASGEWFAKVVFKSFDPHTGKRLADEVQSLTVAEINEIIPKLEAQLEAFKGVLPQVQALEDAKKAADQAKADAEAKAIADAAKIQTPPIE